MSSLIAMTIKKPSVFPRVVIRVSERDVINVATLPIAARNILTAKIAGYGNILVVVHNPSLKETITAALDRTTVAVSPLWINVKDLADALVTDDTVIYVGSGVLVIPELLRSAAQLATAKRERVVTLSGGVDDIQEHALADSSFYVDGTADIVDAEKWVFRNLQKKTDGLVSRILNRPVSTRISRHLARTSLKPIHLTGFTGLSALATFFTLLMGGSTGIVIGCILFHATSVIDGFDGEIARAKFLATPFGAGLDTAVDMVGNILFFTGLTTALYLQYGTPYHLLGAYILLAAVTSVVLLSLVLRFGPGNGSFDTLGLAIQARLKHWPKTARIVSAAEMLLKRDFFAFATAVLALLGMAHVVPWLLAGGMTLWFLAILFNAQYILNATPETITPQHLQRATLAPSQNHHS